MGKSFCTVVRTDVKDPSEKCTGVSGAWHGMSEGSVTPGGSVKHRSRPRRKPKHGYKRHFTLENSENPCLGYIAEIILFFIWGQGS